MASYEVDGVLYLMATAGLGVLLEHFHADRT